MSRFAIAPTDLGWFARLRDGVPLQTVNFWTPTPWNVRGLGAGDRLYFMLKSPIRKIGGYGEFVRYGDMSAGAAWEAYGIGNGVADRAQLVERITHFALDRAQTFTPSDNPTIGCIELRNPVMFDDSEFLVPEQCGHSFPRQVVKIKYFDEPDGMAAKIGAGITSRPFALVAGDPGRSTTTRKDRKGQSVFRQTLLSRYGYRC